MTLWMAFTIAAAAMQTLRSVLQKKLRDGGLSTAGGNLCAFSVCGTFGLCCGGRDGGDDGRASADAACVLWLCADGGDRADCGDGSDSAAFSLQSAAYVRALGQVEIVFGLVIGSVLIVVLAGV